MQKQTIDHTGKEFDSVKKMTQFYGVDYGVYNQRIWSGWTLKDALTKPTRKRNRRDKIIEDHLGNRYDSKEEMCRYYGIDTNRYIKRVRAGWSVEEALTTAVKPQAKRSPYRTDHLGNKYQSQVEMCQKYGIHSQTFRGRMTSGFSLQII